MPACSRCAVRGFEPTTADLSVETTAALVERHHYWGRLLCEPCARGADRAGIAWLEGVGIAVTAQLRG